jgi:SAM-dependent methyltransferase
MTASRFMHRSTLTLCLSLIATALFAQAPAARGQFEPQVGQPGKDVVWVPTAQELVDKMLDIAKVTPEDFVMDLGSGDGRTVITAARRGARAVGVEYNPDMVELATRNAGKQGVSDKATFLKADLFEIDLSHATVITMFLLPSINLRLRPKILDLEPGTRIVSNTFTMEDWQPDDIATVTGSCSSWCSALFWIVPAKVQGTWQWPQAELTATQHFQMVAGSVKSGATITPITDGRLRGDQISFIAGGARYTGRVNGNAIEGTVTSDGRTSGWNAHRTGS